MNELEDLVEPRPTDTTAPAECRPLFAHQIAVPAQNRLRLNQPAESLPLNQAVEGGDDRAISRPQRRPLDLTPEHAQLVGEQEQFRVRVSDPQSYVGDVKQ
jgi:hypothetical protein